VDSHLPFRPTGAGHHVEAYDHYRDWGVSDAVLADGAEDHPPARMSLGGRADHEQGCVAGGLAQRRSGLPADDAAHHRHAGPFAGKGGLEREVEHAPAVGSVVMIRPGRRDVDDMEKRAGPARFTHRPPQRGDGRSDGLYADNDPRPIPEPVPVAHTHRIHTKTADR